ncbi:hypothetical protein N500_0702, partial [Wolbachia pipientis wUni]
NWLKTNSRVYKRIFATNRKRFGSYQLFASFKKNLILRSMIAELIKIIWKISKLP